VLVAVRDSDATSPWDVLAKNALHEQKLRDWKHASAEERAFDKLASVMIKVGVEGDDAKVQPVCVCGGVSLFGGCTAGAGLGLGLCLCGCQHPCQIR
jgi:hypothetical protein